MVEAAVKRAGGNAARDYRLEHQIGFILRRASQRHLSIFAALVPGLTSMQFAALAKLFELGPVSQNGLGRETAMDAATIKGVADRLSQRGLVTTRQNQTDRRRMVVELSPAGAKLFARLAETAFQVGDRTLAPLSTAERRSLLRLLARLTWESDSK